MKFRAMTQTAAALGLGLTCVAAAWPAAADPPWGRGHGRHYRHHPHAVYYAPPRPVYYAPPPVVVYHQPPVYYPAYPAYQPYPVYPPYGYYRSPPISNQDVGGIIGYGIGAVIGRSLDYRR
jgi:hypothetical protein